MDLIIEVVKVLDFILVASRIVSTPYEIPMRFARRSVRQNFENLHHIELKNTQMCDSKFPK